MSARGARSRKAVAKDIEKKEKKAVTKGKVVEAVRTDAFLDWPPPRSVSSRPYTVSSDASRATSRSSSSNRGFRSRMNTIHSNDSIDFKLPPTTSSIRRSASISGSSTQEREKNKYQSKSGKDTKAPRGRGGGVPVKRPAVTPAAAPIRRSETRTFRKTSNQKTWIGFRIWEGGDEGFPPYGGWDYDEHMQTGNVLVYFKEEQQSEDRPTPQIRCDYEALENSGSTWLRNALLYGGIEESEDDWTKTDPPQSLTNYPRPPGYARASSAVPSEQKSPSSSKSDRAYFGVPANGTPSHAQYYADTELDWQHSQDGLQQSPDLRPTHELWFSAPPHAQSPQAQRLYHVAIRNFLALLHDKPIVGADLYDMLSTLQPEILMMYDLDQDTQCSNRSREHSLQIILQYLNRRGLDDVRNSVKTALDLLAWSELENVKWKQGYIESFTHLVGVMSPQVEELPEFRRLSVGTRRNLTIAAKSLQLRVMEAEEKLAAFDFSELWGDDPRVTSGTIHQSYTAFRQFLINHYTRAYGNWPPVQGSTWLNRRIVRALQDDFGTLYDYLVDRDVVWDSQEERPGRKWQMVKRRDEEFHPDSLLSVTDMLVNFDSKHGYLHIPHPYPLLPREVAQVKSPVKKGFFSSLKKPKVDVSRDAKTHLQLSIIFSDATNIEKMDASSNGSNLIDQFERFELNAELKNATPREARLGRWILLYGILQVLSTLSVDVRGLKWTQGVRHFLCAELKRCPEWVTEGQTEYLEASQTRSWCWQRPWSPTRITYQPAELEGNAMRVVEESDAATLDGATMINEDIRRIGEKIDRMRMTVQGNGDLGHRRGSERRVEKGKMRESGLDMAKGIDDSYRLTQSDYERRPLPPIIPLRSQHRSPLREHGPGYDEFQGMQGKRGDYFGGYRDDRAGWV